MRSSETIDPRLLRYLLGQGDGGGGDYAGPWAPGTQQALPQQLSSSQNVLAALFGQQGADVGVATPIGGIDIPPADLNDPFGSRWGGGEQWGGFDPSVMRTFQMLGGYGFSPPIGTPGWFQGPTMIPSQFDPQGYPFAQAAFPAPIGPDYNILGGSRHMGMRLVK
jgi:hypothetical protein